MHANFDEVAKIILKRTLALSSTAAGLPNTNTNCSIILSIVTSYTERMHLKHFFKRDYSFPAFLGIQYIRDSPDTFLMSFQNRAKIKYLYVSTDHWPYMEIHIGVFLFFKRK